MRRALHIGTAVSATLLLHPIGVRRDDTFATQRDDEGAGQVIGLYNVCLLVERPIPVRVSHDLVAQLLHVSIITLRR